MRLSGYLGNRGTQNHKWKAASLLTHKTAGPNTALPLCIVHSQQITGSLITKIKLRFKQKEMIWYNSLQIKDWLGYKMMITKTQKKRYLLDLNQSMKNTLNIH
jgi:hypothetical protein